MQQAKRDETLMMKAGHQLRAIEGQYKYMIREMRLQSEM